MSTSAADNGGPLSATPAVRDERRHKHALQRKFTERFRSKRGFGPLSVELQQFDGMEKPEQAQQQDILKRLQKVGRVVAANARFRTAPNEELPFVRRAAQQVQTALATLVKQPRNVLVGVLFLVVYVGVPIAIMRGLVYSLVHQAAANIIHGGFDTSVLMAGNNAATELSESFSHLWDSFEYLRGSPGLKSLANEAQGSAGLVISGDRLDSVSALACACDDAAVQQ